MTEKRRQFTSQFKFKVALEAIKELKTVSEVASQYSVHPTQVRKWRKQLMTEGPAVFGNNITRQLQEHEAREAELFEQIGRLKMELEWLKKKATQFD